MITQDIGIFAISFLLSGYNGWVEMETDMIKKLTMMIADIDGTMVNDQRQMMPVTREAIGILHDHGVIIGIGSGRPVDQHMLSMCESYELKHQFDVFIGMNGGEIYDRTHEWRDSFFMLKKQYIREIIEMMKPTGLHPFIYGHDEMVCAVMDEQMYAAGQRNQSPVRIAADISKLWAEDNHKLLYRVPDPDRMPEYEAFAAAHPSSNYQYFKTNPVMLEFQDPRVNKGAGLLSLCSHMNIPTEEVMAFGDTTNDNQMLKTAGWGVCMKNGTADTKAYSDAVTDNTNEEDGLGRYLMEYWIRPNHWD